jgi:hypothetical protein
MRPDPQWRSTGQFNQAVLRGELRLLLHRRWFLLQSGESTLLNHEVATTSGGCAFEKPAGSASDLK